MKIIRLTGPGVGQPIGPRDHPDASHRLTRQVCAALVLLLLLPATSSATNSAELWDALRSGGHVALLRHALAPGTGDPANFSLDDCATQRNLSQDGREQARQLGKQFRANGIDAARVFSSQWCRSMETAELLGLGPVNELPALNSFFRYRQRRGEQTREMEDWIAGQALDQPVVLVTHQVNISALSGAYAGSGELLVLRRKEDGGLSLLGSIR